MSKLIKVSVFKDVIAHPRFKNLIPFSEKAFIVAKACNYTHA